MPNSDRPRDLNLNNQSLGTALGIAGVALGGLVGYIVGKTSPSPNRPNVPMMSPRTSPFPPRKLDEEFNEPSTSAVAASTVPATTKECMICLQKFEDIKKQGGDVHTTPCGHIFCHPCIYQCLSRYKSCPVCRARVGPRDTIRIFL